MKERAKKWRSNLIKKKHSDDSNATPPWGVSLDNDEAEEDPEYLGAPSRNTIKSKERKISLEYLPK